MKRIFLLLILGLAVVACKNSEEKQTDEKENVAVENTEDAAENNTYRGEFLYMTDGAVLKGDSFIYGVTLDDKARELADRVKPVKVDSFDMVGVYVRGEVSNKAEGAEGWDEIITITEIINVSPKPAKADIKFEEKKS